MLFGYFFLESKEKKKNIKISEKFFTAKILSEKNQNQKAKILLIEIINSKHKFYAPLSLNLIIDQKIISVESEVESLFEKVLLIKKINKEDINLIKIKKALYLLNNSSEDKILDILNPIVNSNSQWKPQAIELLYEYFLNKGEKVKSQEYFQLLQAIKD